MLKIIITAFNPKIVIKVDGNFFVEENMSKIMRVIFNIFFTFGAYI